MQERVRAFFDRKGIEGRIGRGWRLVNIELLFDFEFKKLRLRRLAAGNAVNGEATETGDIGDKTVVLWVAQTKSARPGLIRPAANSTTR